METDAIIGSVVVVVALAVITALVAWSRRTINLIADRNLKSARDITRELSNEREA